MTLLPGVSIGPYRVVEQVGRGGMATVYKAYQPALARHVAIKVLPAFFAEEEGFRERFQQEAIAIARFRHPNILSVFDYGDENGTAYIVTEFVDGGTLAQQLGKPLPLDYAVRLLSPIASALDYAHAQGVLHRDVKPSNILLTMDGAPILSDFGLAKMMGSLPRLTRTGTTVGTPEYMAPEQAAGEEAGPAADRYALAVVAYEMLTGKVPFTAETPLAVLLAHLHKPLPLPREVNPELPPGVQEALLKGLAKLPGDRYPTAASFVAAIADASRGVPWAGAAAQGSRRLLLVAGVSGALLLLTLVGSGMLLLRSSSDQQAPMERTGPPPSAVQAESPTPADGEGKAAAPPTPTATAPPKATVAAASADQKWKLLRSDDFSDPAKGLFRDNVRDSDQWEYGYKDGALVARIRGHSVGFGAEASGQVPGDFAAEVRVRVIQSRRDLLVSFNFEPDNGYAFSFAVWPADRKYNIWSQKEQRDLASGRSAAMKPESEENLLRMEVQGDTMRALINGQVASQVKHEGLTSRGGTVGLILKIGQVSAASEGEVRFTDFKVYALEP